MKRLAVFGTSANPFSNNHATAVRWLLEKGYDRVMVVPAASHPLKRDLLPFPHRFATATLGIGALAPELHDRVEVSWIEEELRAGSTAPVYTYDVLRRIRALRGEEYGSIVLAIGPDIVAELPLWKHVPEIEAEFGFEHFVDEFGMRATIVRRRREARDPTWRELVHSDVADYLDQHGLYEGTVTGT